MGKGSYVGDPVELGMDSGKLIEHLQTFSWKAAPQHAAPTGIVITWADVPLQEKVTTIKGGSSSRHVLFNQEVSVLG